MIPTSHMVSLCLSLSLSLVIFIVTLGAQEERGNSVFVSADGTVWITGRACSEANDGDVPNTKHGGYDLWLLGINPTFNPTTDDTAEPIYNRCFGGSGRDLAYSICVQNNGTVWIIGSIDSNDGDTPDTKHDGPDIWLLGINPKETPDKQITYNHCFGEDGYDEGYSLCVSSNGIVWMTGYIQLTSTSFDMFLFGINPKKD